MAAGIMQCLCLSNKFAYILRSAQKWPKQKQFFSVPTVVPLHRNGWGNARNVVNGIRTRKN
jgi:hypothetical protein